MLPLQSKPLALVIHFFPEHIVTSWTKTRSLVGPAFVSISQSYNASHTGRAKSDDPPATFVHL